MKDARNGGRKSLFIGVTQITQTVRSHLIQNRGSRLSQTTDGGYSRDIPKS